MIHSIGTPQDKKRELLIASVFMGATNLAKLDNVATTTCLRALALHLEQRMATEFNLCTHGCDITPSCVNRVLNTCSLKPTTCEGVEDEGVCDRELPSEGSEED